MRLQINDNSTYGVTSPKVTIIVIDDDERVSAVRNETTKFVREQGSKSIFVKSNETTGFVANTKDKEVHIKDMKSLSVTIVGINDSGVQKLIIF